MSEIALKLIREAKRTKAKRLDLINLDLKKLPKELSELVWLEELFIRGNQVPNLSVLSSLINLHSLDLSNNQLPDLSTLPNFTSLHNLNLSNNKLSDISTLSEFIGLQNLDINSNQLSNIYALSKLLNLQNLYLSNNQLSDISPLSNLLCLQTLDIGYNQLLDISPLSMLINLQKLDLDTNQLLIISSLSELLNLQTLNLRNNKLLDISILKNLDKLEHLDIRYNDSIDVLDVKNIIQRIGIDFFTGYKSLSIDIIDEYGEHHDYQSDNSYIDNNIKVGKIGGVYVGPKLNNLPPEIMSSGSEVIQNYLNTLAEQNDTKLYEAKLLILGDGGVGKTTLFRKLQNINAEMPEESESTEGIDIHKPSFEIFNGEKFTINLWDFGGQEIYHATHQFFLSKRSLYILVADTRREGTDFSYWLQLIELLGEDSPVIIVQNERGSRKKQIDIKSMRMRFRNILEVISLDLKEDTSAIEKLYDKIQHHIQNLPHVGTTLPKSWINIRLRLESLSENEPHITPQEYYRICEEEGIQELDKMLILSQYLHDLGVFLHFQNDEILKEIIILQNQWATKAVYAILDDKKIISQQGKFNYQDTDAIWSKYKYYSKPYYELLRLMQKFELCYEVPYINIPTYVAPQLLNIAKPKYQWRKRDNIIIKYHYKFMPKGLMARFIVRMHRYIKGAFVWNKGVVLQDGEINAEVIEEYVENTITVKVSGKFPKDFLYAIRREFSQLHDTFGEKKLKVTELIPCFCKKCQESKYPEFYSYADLMRRKKYNKETIECNFSYEKIKVIDLLNFNHIKNSKNIAPRKLFISYSKADEVYLEAFKEHLSPLVRNNDLITWDEQNVIPGEEWDERIVQELNEADIIVFLVSSNFCAADYIVHKEVETAIQRHERKEARVIPVIIRDCRWEKMSFSKLSVLPRDGKSIKSHKDDMDTAWLEVVKEIESVLFPLKA